MLRIDARRASTSSEGNCSGVGTGCRGPMEMPASAHRELRSSIDDLSGPCLGEQRRKCRASWNETNVRKCSVTPTHDESQVGPDVSIVTRSTLPCGET